MVTPDPVVFQELGSSFENPQILLSVVFGVSVQLLFPEGGPLKP